ncbi:xylan 1,4-beta-xylosidase, partial [Salmonella enterica subsp. enterica serovar Enteritidis]|nr:xylan 1,4-beta-xylosidase [Salmonella enterica subsp. enterica serovar Enteritidis]
MDISRRAAFGAALAGGAAALLRPGAGEATPNPMLPDATALDWKRGFDNQRVCDLGDGRFLNPLLAGDHPDPAILKDGADYY